MHKSIEDFKGVRIIGNLDRARRVEVEIPGLLGRKTIPYEKLPDFLKTIGIPPWIVTGQTTSVEQKSGERDDRFLKPYEKLSGLKFSKETRRVYAPNMAGLSSRLMRMEDSYATLETMYYSIPYIRLWRRRKKWLS
jgi:hypothetical protein